MTDQHRPYFIDDQGESRIFFPDGDGFDSDPKDMKAQLHLPEVDLDVDSDNQNGFEEPQDDQAEDVLENDAVTGKVIWATTGGLDANPDSHFVPLKVRLSDNIKAALTRYELSDADVQIAFSYPDAADPAEASSSGLLRLWTVDAGTARNRAEHYLEPGKKYLAKAKLGLVPGSEQTVYAEAVAGATDGKTRKIDVEITINGVEYDDIYGQWDGKLSDIVYVSPIQADLEIYRPLVVDATESLIPEKDEETKGSVTFVNLDNDDNDDKFDDSDDVVAGGDDELVKVRLKLPKNITAGTVTLTATAGAGDIKVWKQNDKAAASAYNLGDALTVPGDFTVDGDFLVKELWVEGTTAQTAQQATKLRMEFSHNGFTSADTATLTVIGVEKVEWVGYNNAHDDSNNLDADPNWPTGLTPNAKRVFPDKRVFASGGGFVQDPQPRSIMRVKTTLSVAPPIDIKVYLRAFDADDPTADADAVDNEAGPDDNRGAAGTFGWQASGVIPNTDVTKELSFAAGETDKQADYIVSRQPGDNYRLVANADKDFLLRLNNNDNELNVGGAAANANKQRIVNQDIPVSTNPADREVRQADKYSSDVLTVWRFMHVERDSMAALPAGSNEISGTVSGIVGTGAALTEVTTATNLADGSNDLDTAAPNTDNGRFENGTLVLGADATKKTISPITGNGTNRLVFSATNVSGLSFDAADTDFFSGTDHNIGTITNVIKSGTSFVWTLNVTTEEDADWTEFVGGTLSVGGGGTMTITAQNKAAGTMTTSSLNIPFSVKDDDVATLPSLPDTGMMAPQFAPAYILPVNDGGGNPAFDRQTVAPSLNVGLLNTELSAEFGKAGAFESKVWRLPDYWIAYALGGYQGPTTNDGDSNSEGTIWGLTTSVPAPDGGTVIFVEALPDNQRAFGWTSTQADDIMRRVVVHEIGHQFFIPDQDPALGAGNNLYWYAELFNPATSVRFLPKHLDRIRSTTSPGATR